MRCAPRARLALARPVTGVDVSPAIWWVGEITSIARHEYHHVAIAQSFLPALDAAVASSTCQSVGPALSAIALQMNTAQCDFDLQQYGYAQGLTLSSCLAQ